MGMIPHKPCFQASEEFGRYNLPRYHIHQPSPSSWGFPSIESPFIGNMMEIHMSGGFPIGLIPSGKLT